MKKKSNKKGIFLKNSDRNQIEKIVRESSDGKIVRRALALIALDSGYPQGLLENLHLMTDRTARSIKSKYLNGGLKMAIYDGERSGQPSKIDKRKSQQIAAIACSAPPDGYARWTLDLITKESQRKGIMKKISRESVRIILHSHELKPWLKKMWCVPNLNQEYINRMEDVLAVYEREYDKKSPVVCLDEKPVQLLSDTRVAIPMKEGKVKKQDYEYKRMGTANVFRAVEPKTGLHYTKVTPNRKGPEFAKFLKSIADAYPKAKTIHLVMDNLSTHTSSKSLIEFYGQREGQRIWNRFSIHYTPKHASWLNQAEIAIGIYAKQSLGKDRIPTIEALTKRSTAWTALANKKRIKIDWKFTRKKARKKFKYKTGKN